MIISFYEYILLDSYIFFTNYIRFVSTTIQNPIALFCFTYQILLHTIDNIYIYNPLLKIEFATQ